MPQSSPIPGCRTPKRSLSADLTKRLGRPVEVNLGQVPESMKTKSLKPKPSSAWPTPPSPPRCAPKSPASRKLGHTPPVETELRAAVPFQLAAADIDAEKRTATLIAAPHNGLSISAYRTMEEGLKLNFPDWAIRIVRPFPNCRFIAFRQWRERHFPGWRVRARRQHLGA